LLQVTFLASFTAVFYGLGWYVRNRMRLRASGIALTGVASLIVPLDFYAFYLSGGFLGLLWSDVWLLTSAVCLAAYLLTIYLIQAEFFGYLVGLAAGSLLAASLRFIGLETVWWPMLLSGQALALALTAVALSKLPVKSLRRWQVLKTPFWHLSVLGTTAILAISTGQGLLRLAWGDNFLTASDVCSSDLPFAGKILNFLFAWAMPAERTNFAQLCLVIVETGLIGYCQKWPDSWE
jgi:hypothetical protein